MQTIEANAGCMHVWGSRVVWVVWGRMCGVQGELQLLHPAPPYYPFPEDKCILVVIYGVLLWADMNAATPLGAWVCSVIAGGVVGM